LSAGPAATEPWPDPVDGVELLDDIAVAVKRHVSVPMRAEQAIACLVLHAHALAAATNTPQFAVKQLCRARPMLRRFARPAAAVD
jgi:hypothetical protein